MEKHLRYKNETTIDMVYYKHKKIGMVANETTLHQKPNDKVNNNYRSSYGFQQCVKLILHSSCHLLPTYILCLHKNKRRKLFLICKLQ